MDAEVDEFLCELVDDSIWEFFSTDDTASPDTIDEVDVLFRKIPAEILAVSASGGGVPGPAECSTSEFRTTNDKELERLVANNHNSNTAASTKNWL